MITGVPQGHPLHRLLASLTERNFSTHLGWRDTGVIRYVTDVLTEFVHIDRLFKIRDARGRRVEEVAEMLAEGDVMHRASSMQRERDVHKHIGDYTLFMTGLFPEYLCRQRTARPVLSPDGLLDFIQVGKRSYRIVAEFGDRPHEETAPLFRKLSENFELCVFGLGYVRADLDRLRNPRIRELKGRLLG
jgi:hypothetical protein